MLTFAVSLLATPQQCGEPGAGPVLGGIDLVEAAALAGHNVSLPRGTEAHGVNAFGYRFLFASEANAEAFRSDPDAHVPRFGGYCGIAMTGHDQCCAPLKACLGPTCVHRDERCAALFPIGTIRADSAKPVAITEPQPCRCPGSYGAYALHHRSGTPVQGQVAGAGDAARLVFFFSPRVKLGWDRDADANLVTANANWAALLKRRNVTMTSGVAHCFNTDYLWCLDPGFPPYPPPPFPQCGTSSSVWQVT